MAATPDDDADPTSNRYIPRAARAVPHDDVVHTIEFRKISYPLTDRPSELWVVETNHRGHIQWRTLERFLDDFVPTSLGEPSNFAQASCAHLEVLAHQWREYYDVPDPFPHGGPPQRQALRRHLLPQPTQPNIHFDQPVSVFYPEPLGTLCLSPLSRKSGFEPVNAKSPFSPISTCGIGVCDLDPSYDD